MADVVTGPTIMQENDQRVVIKYVNQSDGTGGTTVFGDVSAMATNSNGDSCLHLQLLRVWYSSDTGDGGDSYVRMDEEDNNGDIPVIGLTGSGYWDFREFGGIPANQSANTNQDDINIVIPGTADAGNMYTVVMECTKTYVE